MYKKNTKIKKQSENSIIHLQMVLSLIHIYGRNCSLRYGRSEGDYGTGVEVAEGDVEKAAVDT